MTNLGAIALQLTALVTLVEVTLGDLSISHFACNNTWNPAVECNSKITVKDLCKLQLQLTTLNGVDSANGTASNRSAIRPSRASVQFFVTSGTETLRGSSLSGVDYWIVGSKTVTLTGDVICEIPIDDVSLSLPPICGQTYLVVRVSEDDGGKSVDLSTPIQLNCPEKSVDLALIGTTQDEYDVYSQRPVIHSTGQSLTYFIPNFKLAVKNVLENSSYTARTGPSVFTVSAYLKPMMWYMYQWSVGNNSNQTLAKTDLSLLDYQLGDVMLHQGNRLVTTNGGRNTPTLPGTYQVDLQMENLVLNSKEVCGNGILVVQLKVPHQPSDYNVLNNFYILPVFVDCWGHSPVQPIETCQVIPNYYDGGQTSWITYTVPGQTKVYEYKSQERSIRALKPDSDGTIMQDVAMMKLTTEIHSDRLMELGQCVDTMWGSSDSFVTSADVLLTSLRKHWDEIRIKNEVQKQQHSKISLILNTVSDMLTLALQPRNPLNNWLHIPFQYFLNPLSPSDASEEKSYFEDTNRVSRRRREVDASDLTDNFIDKPLEAAPTVTHAVPTRVPSAVSGGTSIASPGSSGAIGTNVTLSGSAATVKVAPTVTSTGQQTSSGPAAAATAATTGGRMAAVSSSVASATTVASLGASGTTRPASSNSVAGTTSRPAGVSMSTTVAGATAKGALGTTARPAGVSLSTAGARATMTAASRTTARSANVAGATTTAASGTTARSANVAGATTTAASGTTARSVTGSTGMLPASTSKSASSATIGSASGSTTRPAAASTVGTVSGTTVRPVTGTSKSSSTVVTMSSRSASITTSGPGATGTTTKSSTGTVSGLLYSTTMRPASATAFGAGTNTRAASIAAATLSASTTTKPFSGATAAAFNSTVNPSSGGIQTTTESNRNPRVQTEGTATPVRYSATTPKSSGSLPSSPTDQLYFGLKPRWHEEVMEKLYEIVKYNGKGLYVLASQRWQAISLFLKTLLYGHKEDFDQYSYIPKSALDNLVVLMKLAIGQNLPRLFDDIPEPIVFAVTSWMAEKQRGGIELGNSACDYQEGFRLALNVTETISQEEQWAKRADQLTLLAHVFRILLADDHTEYLAELYARITAAQKMGRTWMIRDGIPIHEPEATDICRRYVAVKLWQLQTYPVFQFAGRTVSPDQYQSVFWTQDRGTIFRGDRSELTGQVFWSKVATCSCPAGSTCGGSQEQGPMNIITEMSDQTFQYHQATLGMEPLASGSLHPNTVQSPAMQPAALRGYHIDETMDLRHGSNDDVSNSRHENDAEFEEVEEMMFGE